MVTTFHRRSAALLAIVLLGCSGDDGRDLAARPSAPVTTPAPVGDDSAELPPEPASAEVDTLPGEPIDTSSDGVTDEISAPPRSVVVVPETGVPGLDASDAFCAAWSRLGGSFQVIAVNAAFGDGEAASVARLEVLAGPTVDAAHTAMASNWPADLAAERDAALDDVFGPFARRVGGAVDRLRAAGAGDDDLAIIEATWVAALARRDPADPVITVDIPDELLAIVEGAAAAQLAEVGSWFDDESLRTDAAAPATDAYLAATCPDQGTLGGQDATG